MKIKVKDETEITPLERKIKLYFCEGINIFLSIKGMHRVKINYIITKILAQNIGSCTSLKIQVKK